MPLRVDPVSKSSLDQEKQTEIQVYNNIFGEARAFIRINMVMRLRSKENCACSSLRFGFGNNSQFFLYFRDSVIVSFGRYKRKQ